MKYVESSLRFGLKEPPRSPKYQKIAVSSVYVTMRDGVQLAVEISLPADLGTDTLPALLTQTRYWREFQLRFPFNRLLPAAGPQAKFFVPFGFALVRVDVRGTGASFGTWRSPWSPEEAADMAELVEWIISQEWSNGQVAGFGNSYSGTTAELLAASGHTAVKGSIVRFNEFDLYTDIAFPGGILNTGFNDAWSKGNSELDRNKLPVDMNAYQRLALAGVKRVDGDNGSLLKAALKQHRGNVDTSEMLRAVECRDDRFEPIGLSIDDISVHSYENKIAKSPVKMDVWGSWFDAATADGVIKRFLNQPNIMRAIIGPWAHGGSKETSPYLKPAGDDYLTYKDQMYEMVQFFDSIFDKSEPESEEKLLYYYTLGEEKWKATDVFPLKDTESVRLYCHTGRALKPEKPDGKDCDQYTVDFLATTGRKNRWHTELSGGMVLYGDRAEADRLLLCYDTEPLEQDMEITGYPVVGLYVSSSAEDGAFFAYLEDVDPEGRVTYLTEGQLRAAHRKTASEPPYRILVPYHTFKRADMQPLVQGEVSLLQFGLQPISVLIEAGHRLRLAISGADSDTFTRIPAEGKVDFAVYRGGETASYLELPVIHRNGLS